MNTQKTIGDGQISAEAKRDIGKAHNDSCAAGTDMELPTLQQG